MQRLFYSSVYSSGFPFADHFDVQKIPYDQTVKTFPQGSWFGETQLEWENRELESLPMFSEWARDHLVRDSDSRLILYCGHEIIGTDSVKYRFNQLQSWGIQIHQIHFVAASVAQAESIRDLIPAARVSVFHHWEVYTANKTRRWHSHSDPTHRFLFLNRRNSRERLLLAHLLLTDSELKPNINYSLHPGIYWIPTTRKDEIDHHMQVITELPLQWRNTVQAWCRTNPWRTIPTPGRNTPHNYTLFDDNTENLIRSGAVSIVTESHPYHRHCDFMPTEKIMRTIAAGRPFIVLGTPRYLTHLHSMGYHTFDTLWDESYDQTLDLYARINQIVNTIKAVNQLKEIPKLSNHNRQHLIARTQPNYLKTLLDKELADQFTHTAA
jgi:hypothetical protein